MKRFLLLGSGLSALLMTLPALAQVGLPALNVQTGAGGQTYSLSIQLLALMTALTLLPAALLMMTAFTRIVIVLALLRQALGLAQTPPNQVILGLALFLTFFVMAPVGNEVYARSVQPYLAEKITLQEAAQTGQIPLKRFMLAQTRESDIAMFAEIAGNKSFATPEDVPFTTLMPAFLTSELKTAFQIGFMIFIPFVVIDLVVASVLMAMGMMMLSPMLISLPFKLMLFVLVDGWALILSALAASFHGGASV